LSEKSTTAACSAGMNDSSDPTRTLFRDSGHALSPTLSKSAYSLAIVDSGLAIRSNLFDYPRSLEADRVEALNASGVLLILRVGPPASRLLAPVEPISLGAIGRVPASGRD